MLNPVKSVMQNLPKIQRKAKKGKTFCNVLPFLALAQGDFFCSENAYQACP